MKQNENRPEPTKDKLRSLVSLNQVAYDDLFSVFDQFVNKKLSLYTLKGQMHLFPNEEESIVSSLYGSKARLDFI